MGQVRGRLTAFVSVAAVLGLASAAAALSVHGAVPHRDMSTPTSAPVADPSWCGRPGTVTSLAVTRTDPFPQNGTMYAFPASVVSTDRPAVVAVAVTVCHLPASPPGTFACPNDAGISYLLTFRAAQAAASVTADPGGCAHVELAGTSRVATVSFWDDLATALGLPPLRVGCDVFDGRSPGSVPACGALVP